MKFSVNRLKEPSTWAAIGTLALVFGATDQLAEHIATAGATVAALIAVFMPGSAGR
jgi:hypothetical protein